MLSRFFDALVNKNNTSPKRKPPSPTVATAVPAFSANSIRRRNPSNVAINIEEEPPTFSRFTGTISPSQFEYSSEPLLRLVLSNHELHDMMMQFATDELSAENIRCWDGKRNLKCVATNED